MNPHQRNIFVTAVDVEDDFSCFVRCGFKYLSDVVEIYHSSRNDWGD
jgi:hypothetical protein